MIIARKLLGTSTAKVTCTKRNATIAVMAGAFRDVQPKQVPDASTITRIVQQVGGSFGASVLAMILAGGLATNNATPAARAAAFGTAFWWAIGFTVLALLPALLLPGRMRARNKITNRA